MDTQLGCQAPVFVVMRAPVIQSGVQTLPIVEELDVFEDALPSLGPGAIVAEVDQLGLERVEE